jgi:membrane-bound lytic murein transglycosylase D
MLIRILLSSLLATLLFSTAALAEALPRPAALEPQVRFWTRIYSEVGHGAGLIHDSRHMDVVYETIRLPKGLSSRARERRIERTKKGYAAILRRLGGGKRSGLSPQEARVLALWPSGVANSTLRGAAKRVRFQLGQSDRFQAGLVRSGQWRSHIVKMMRKHGVPAELAALPHVESSFNPAAYSRVGAAGLFQFTRSTGRLFMRVDSVIDERMDPFIAAEGAARLLRSNYEQLGSWPLAITAYNHGAGGMKRAKRMLGTDDIATVVAKYKSRSFGFASRNFYTELLAAIDVDRDRERHFGSFTPAPPVDYEIVVLDAFYTANAVQNALGVDRETLREHNRALRPAVWNGAKYLPRGFELRVPSGLSTKPVEVAIASISASQRFAKQHRDRLYKVRRGDTLSKIARRYGVRQRDLVALNNLRSRNRIRAGQVLTLPDVAGSGAPVAAARSAKPASGDYHVRRGDTISKIASRFGLTQSRLVSMNGLRNRHQIAVGQRLRVSDVMASSKPVAKPKPAPVVTARVEPPPAEPEMDATSADAAVSRVEDDVVEAAETAIAGVEPLADSVVDPPEADSAPLVIEDPEDVFDTEPEVVGSAPVIPASDPSDYAVTASGRITVQAAETLGHYADWLEVPTSRLRRLNKLKYGRPVVIGRQTRLEFSKVEPSEFERRRLEYHHAIQEEFFDAYEVVGTDSHLLRRGDTLWYLAEKRYEVPVWLLRQYNPKLDFGALQAGMRMVIPRIAPRS